MGDHLQVEVTFAPSWYLVSQPRQLGLNIRPDRQSDYQQTLGVNRHTTQYTIPVTMILQCKLVSG